MAEDMNLQINIEGTNDTGGSFDSMDEAMSQLQQLASDVSRSFDEFARTISNSFSDAGRAAEEMVKPLGEIGNEAVNSGKEIEDMVKSLFDTQADTAADELAKNIAAIGTSAEESTKKIETMEEAAGKAGSAGSKGNSEGGLFSMSGQMDTMYAGMALGVAAAPLDAGLGASVKAMADYDQAMRLVNEEMKLSQSGFNNLEQAVLSLSNSTGISSQDLANGLYNVVATGVTNTSDALNLLKTAAEGAKAGNTDLNTSTAALNAIMGAYGMKASDAGKIMDVMFTAVNNGQMHFDALAKSVGASATSAATAGVGYQELAAAQATLTNVGKNAESASQNLNSLIMGMIAPTSQATKEAKSLGIEWDAQALKAHGLSYMINEAITATHGNSEELKKLVPNQRAYTAVLALGENAHKQYTETLNKMKDANGATEEALKQTEQGAGESIDKMKAQLTNAGIELVKGLAPALSAVSEKVSELTKWFSGLSPQTQKTIGEVALGAAAFLTLGSSFFMTISAIGGMVSGFKAIGGAVGGAINAFKSLVISEDAVAAGEGLMDSLNPIGWVILIGVAVAAIAAVIITHWNQIKSFFVSTWNAITSLASTVWNGITAFFKKWGVDILAAVMPAIGLPILIAQHWRQITQFANQIWNGAINLIKGIWNSAVAWIQGVAQNFVNIIVNAFNWMYNHNYYFQNLVDFIKNAWTTITNDATAIWNGIVAFFSTVWNAISSVATAFWNREVNGFENIWNGLVNIARTIWNGLSSFFSGLWNGISSGVSSAWNAISSTISSLANSAVNAAKGPFNSLGSFFSGLWGQARQWGSNLINMMADGIKSAAGAVGNAVKNVASSIAGMLGFHSPAKEGPGSDADVWMPNLMKMFTTDIQKYTPQFQSAISNVALGIKTGFTMPVINNVSSTMALPSSSGVSTGPTIIVYASGNITKNEQQLGDTVSRAIYDKVKMQGRI